VKELMKSYEKSMAHSGLALLYPVSVMGKHYRGNGIQHHVTVKFFDDPTVSPDEAHSFAIGESLPVPDANKISVTPKVFKNRFGEDVHVLSLHGEGIDHVRVANGHAKHLGQTLRYEFQPHISVDKELHDKVSQMGDSVTAKQLGIRFGAPQLRHGQKVLAFYKKLELTGLSKSEKVLGLEKSDFSRKAVAGLATMAALLGPAKTSNIGVPKQAPYDKSAALKAIARVESSGGKDTEHADLSGIHAGEKAYGKYGLTPVIIRETVSKHPDLKARHGHLLDMRGGNVSEYMKQNPKLETEIASRHYDRLSRAFGGDFKKVGFAWLNGVAGTARAQREGVNFDDHWHVKKLKNAYEDIKNTPQVADNSKKNNLP
jgi:hypothetical protein